ncbi:MAG: hypothetical protein WCJ26_02505 [bacterium]
MRYLSVNIVIIAMVLLSYSLSAQVSISTDGSPPDAAAMLEVKSDNKGLLLPRLDYNNRPASPVAGLLIYVIAHGPFGNGLYVGSGTGWVKLGTVNYTIGQTAEGGVIVYVDSSGVHGLAAALQDQGQSDWGCDGTLIGPGAQHFRFMAGDTNTMAIVAGCSQASFAAKKCDTLTLMGYTNWYLPSADEMDSLWVHRSLLSGLVPLAWYWSSTEADATGAFFVMNDPAFSPYWITSKGYADMRIRCVRKF